MKYLKRALKWAAVGVVSIKTDGVVMKTKWSSWFLGQKMGNKIDALTAKIEIERNPSTVYFI